MVDLTLWSDQFAKPKLARTLFNTVCRLQQPFRWNVDHRVIILSHDIFAGVAQRITSTEFANPVILYRRFRTPRLAYLRTLVRSICTGFTPHLHVSTFIISRLHETLCLLCSAIYWAVHQMPKTSSEELISRYKNAQGKPRTDTRTKIIFVIARQVHVANPP